jgi:epoxyqueuosine reductase QueG
MGEKKFHIFDEAGAGLDSFGTSIGSNVACELAKACGFSNAGLVALPHSEASRDANRFTQWIAAGHAGTMQYLSRTNGNGELVRARVSTPFPWARSAIVCFANYNSARLRMDCGLCMQQSRGCAWESQAERLSQGAAEEIEDARCKTP